MNLINIVLVYVKAVLIFLASLFSASFMSNIFNGCINNVIAYNYIRHYHFGVCEAEKLIVFSIAYKISQYLYFL